MIQRGQPCILENNSQTFVSIEHQQFSSLVSQISHCELYQILISEWIPLHSDEIRKLEIKPIFLFGSIQKTSNNAILCNFNGQEQSTFSWP